MISEELEAEVRQQSERALHDVVVAGSFFRFGKPDVRPPLNLIEFAEWLRDFRTTRSVGQANVALTESEVVLLRFTFSPTRFRRVLRHWPRSTTRSIRLDRFSVSLKLSSGREIEIHAVEPDADAAYLVAALTAS